MESRAAPGQVREGLADALILGGEALGLALRDVGALVGLSSGHRHSVAIDGDDIVEAKGNPGGAFGRKPSRQRRGGAVDALGLGWGSFVADERVKQRRHVPAVPAGPGRLPWTVPRTRSPSTRTSPTAAERASERPKR